MIHRASRHRSALVVAFLAALGGGSAVAQNSLPLSIELTEDSQISRTTAPVRVEMVLNWGGPGILDGQLALDVRDSEGELIGTLLIPDLYLTGGRQVQEFMLPGYRVLGTTNELLMYPTILDRNGKRLGRHEPLRLRIAGGAQRMLVIGVVRDAATAANHAQLDVADSVRLENLLPEYETNRTSPTIVTRTASLIADELPSDPLRLCGYDVIQITGSRLADTNPMQLDALRAWTQAGGAMCVLVDDAGLESEHFRFLNEVVGSTSGTPLFLPDSSGRAVVGDPGSPSELIRAVYGLGRVVVLTANSPHADPNAEHWPETTAFLWHVRREHWDAIAAAGVWDRDKTLETVKQYHRDQRNNYGEEKAAQHMMATDMSPTPIAGGSSVVSHLLPRGMKMVPIWLIALILLLYVVAIGPLDYIVLGRFGLRKFTWIVFPFVTIAFTTFSVALSNSYMKTVDHRSTVVIQDIVAGGRVARETRLELLFPSSSRTITTDVGRGLFIPLRFEDFGQDLWMYGYGGPYGPYGYQQPQTRAKPALIVGRLPIQAEAQQSVPQWTPQLNRITTIPIAERMASLEGIDWDQDIRDTAAVGALTHSLQDSLGRSVGVYIYHLDRAQTVRGDERFFGNTGTQILIDGQWSYVVPDFIKDVSVRTQPGFFGVVSQFAPTGGDRFEDLALMDPTDPQQWLLVVAIEDRDGSTIYRRLYYYDDDDPIPSTID